MFLGNDSSDARGSTAHSEFEQRARKGSIVVSPLVSVETDPHPATLTLVLQASTPEGLPSCSCSEESRARKRFAGVRTEKIST